MTSTYHASAYVPARLAIAECAYKRGAKRRVGAAEETAGDGERKGRESASAAGEW